VDTQGKNEGGFRKRNTRRAKEVEYLTRKGERKGKILSKKGKGNKNPEGVTRKKGA